MKKQPVIKPIIIDYPEDRELLKKEFAKIASAPGFSESVERSRKVIYGKQYKQKYTTELGVKTEENDQKTQGK